MFVYRIVGNGIYFAIIKKEVGFELGLLMKLLLCGCCCSKPDRDKQLSSHTLWPHS